MSAKTRLQEVQSALMKRGVQDVKFCFAGLANNVPNSEVANDAADFLQATMEKDRHTVVNGIGDERA